MLQTFPGHWRGWGRMGNVLELVHTYEAPCPSSPPPPHPGLGHNTLVLDSRLI